MLTRTGKEAKTSKMRSNILSNLLNVLGVAFLAIYSVPQLFYPSFFMDEAYYIASSQAILRGDLFLTQYSFDKPYLLSFWSIPGILLFGNSPLGFRFVAFISYLAGFVLFNKLLFAIVGRVKQSAADAVSWSSQLLVFSFSLVVFLNPLLQSHWVSAFSEPYLLFFTVLFFYLLINPNPYGLAQERKLIRTFLAGLFTKYSMALWAPAFLFFAKPGKEFFSRALSAGKWLIAGWLVWSATNAAKFSSVAWLAGVFSGTQGKTAAERLHQMQVWFDLFVRAHEGTLACLLLATFALIGLFVGCKNRDLKQKEKSWAFYTLVLPVLLHFIAVLVLGSKFYERYWVVFLPVYFALVFYGQSVFSKNRFLQIGLITLNLGLATYFGLQDRRVHEENKTLGRELISYAQAFNCTGSVLHTNLVWESAPFRSKSYVSGCISKECIEESKLGAKEIPQHYLLDKDLPEVQYASVDGNRRVKESIPFSSTRIEKIVLKMLKISKVVESYRADWTQLKPSLSESTSSYFPVWNGPRLSFEGMLQFLGKRNFKITGKLAVVHALDFEVSSPHLRPTLIYKVESIYLNGRDLTELMTIFFPGYVVRIDTLNLKYGPMDGAKPIKVEVVNRELQITQGLAQ